MTRRVERVADDQDKPVTTRLPRSLHRQLKQKAADLEVSMQSIILEALTSWMKDHADAA
jgi:predicted HicB family RNase H-like nuclease